MTYKVAVASSDGKVVNRHFGHAEHFLIFEVVGNSYRFVESRKTQRYCHDQSHGQSTAALDAIADCKAVLVSQIGPGAIENLKVRGVESHVLPDLIERALADYIQKTV
ncbi:dinitrogenase iron-molybdenum cofactor biosynthesis protein [Heliobacterium gestii]|uniref:Dinitrogenase iron-molybdenum cofactor biosynthesis protein n=1 Tax=Heliomicrobium gestii TaxID=2699 RepID=A0A845LB17_HELGE|nr:NifB/NifX family molybdenum-iron cluster-binding protein [Heliomicrobium gestii]MBM7865609.1 putative Fe-Mo cluster-binding NifX family protein [Heliomicrobium gestii]MZP41859.1 dinitrogenase iron-molybdenum cofactor biosynthesis protein [Heliomicrobium gestii]